MLFWNWKILAKILTYFEEVVFFINNITFQIQSNLSLVDNFQVAKVSDLLACLFSFFVWFLQQRFSQVILNSAPSLKSFDVVIQSNKFNNWSRSSEIHVIGDTKSEGKRVLNHMQCLYSIVPQMVALEGSWGRCRKPRTWLFFDNLTSKKSHLFKSSNKFKFSSNTHLASLTPYIFHIRT